MLLSEGGSRGAVQRMRVGGMQPQRWQSRAWELLQMMMKLWEKVNLESHPCWAALGPGWRGEKVGT